MEIQSYYDQIVAVADTPVIAEIGAATCEDTVELYQRAARLSRSGNCEYYAFEPDPRNAAVFASRGLIPHVHFIQAAVGDVNGRAVFHQSSGTNPEFGYEHTLSGSLKAPTAAMAQTHAWLRFDAQQEVHVVRLDDVARLYNIPHIDFIWCDVQGAEDLVLAGGQNTLRRTRFLYTEYCDVSLYEQQLNWQGIQRRLPGSWRIVERWSGDILLENMDFDAATGCTDDPFSSREERIDKPARAGGDVYGAPRVFTAAPLRHLGSAPATAIGPASSSMRIQ